MMMMQCPTTVYNQTVLVRAPVFKVPNPQVSIPVPANVDPSTNVCHLNGTGNHVRPIFPRSSLPVARYHTSREPAKARPYKTEVQPTLKENRSKVVDLYEFKSRRAVKEISPTSSSVWNRWNSLGQCMGVSDQDIVTIDTTEEITVEIEDAASLRKHSAIYYTGNEVTRPTDAASDSTHMDACDGVEGRILETEVSAQNQRDCTKRSGTEKYSRCTREQSRTLTLQEASLQNPTLCASKNIVATLGCADKLCDQNLTLMIRDCKEHFEEVRCTEEYEWEKLSSVSWRNDDSDSTVCLRDMQTHNDATTGQNDGDVKNIRRKFNHVSSAENVTQAGNDDTSERTSSSSSTKMSCVGDMMQDADKPMHETSDMNIPEDEQCLAWDPSTINGPQMPHSKHGNMHGRESGPVICQEHHQPVMQAGLDLSVPKKLKSQQYRSSLPVPAVGLRGTKVYVPATQCVAPVASAHFSMSPTTPVARDIVSGDPGDTSNSLVSSTTEPPKQASLPQL